MNIGIDSDNDLPFKKALNMQNVIIFTASIFNNNHIQYYPSVRLVKCLYKLAAKM